MLIIIIGIISHDGGGQAVPRSSVRKVEAQESWRYASVGVQRPDNQGGQ